MVWVIKHICRQVKQKGNSEALTFRAPGWLKIGTEDKRDKMEQLLS